MIKFDLKKKFQPKTKNRIGLDIGSSAIKMIEISNAPDKASLVSLGSKNTSGNVRVALIDAIKSLADEIKVTAKETAISVSGSSVIVRFVSMPKMRDDELKSAMRFEAEKYLPFPINDCMVDYQVLRKNEREGKLEILLVAVKKAFVMDRVQIAEEAGLAVDVVDIDSFAVSNAYMKNFPSMNADKTAVLLNIGAASTNINIIRNGIIYFVRDVAIGCNEFNATDSKNAAHNLLDEMRLSFSYYENQSGCGIDEIYISGGGAKINGLELLFKESFDSNPVFWDPLQFLDKSAPVISIDLTEKMKGSFAVAVGLALR